MADNKIKPEDNRSNQQNPNKGTSGENKQHKDARDNRSDQKNPNNTKTKNSN